MISVHVLYEYGRDFRPHSSAFIRLLRPLSHPLLRDKLRVTWGRYLPSSPVDVVIVDRLWHPYDIDQASASALVKDIHNKGSKFFYAFDDHFDDWFKENPQQRARYRDIFHMFLDSSDGVMVTTPILGDLYVNQNSNLIVLPNMLDERLIARRSVTNKSNDRAVIGYMGTPTHDHDLEIVLPALVKLHKRFQGNVLFEFIGVLNENYSERFPILKNLPVYILKPHPQQIEYPLFMLWYSSVINWDISIAPLRDTPFNRCKSDIKFLDYAAVGSAGVYNQIPSYQNVIHGSTGLLVGNDQTSWEEALTKLIVDTNLRYKIQKNAVNYLLTERVLCKSVQQWISGIDELLQNAS